jgi:hypothetical protein
MLCAFYIGPWGRLSELFLGIRKDGTFRFEISAEPRGWRWVMGQLGDFCNRRDIAWNSRYAERGTKPPAIWRRR